MSFPVSSYMLSTGSPEGQHHNNQVKVIAGYALQQRLGSGSFAVVYRAVRLPQNSLSSNSSSNSNSGNSNIAADTVAIKAIARTSEKLTKKVLQNLEIEISILRTYRHHNIVCLHDVQKTERHFYLLLEYCAGGDVQGLIRSRQAGRLSEILTRRLMRDLAAGLKFLWGQELIHRDIKPQNLLLTGPLPLDEVDDPEKTPQLEEQRRQANFPSAEFCLKIADFGFARHLQSASLAETLCGSPIYMAPEILQHQRYDAKADLWSVGTVLFEMITGKPPFHGENHIDLLRNIQRKAVRLPPDVRVSREGVNLLRLLLNRNPLSRAGFKEFFEACNSYVALGCRGVPNGDTGTYTPPQSSMNLGTIPEGAGTQDGTMSMITVATSAPQSGAAALPDRPSYALPTVTPSFGPTPTPPMPTSLAKSPLPMGRQYSLQPLVPSPPVSGTRFYPTSNVPDPPTLSLNAAPAYVQMVETSPRRLTNETAVALQESTGDGSFVMVEHGSSQYTNSSSNNRSPGSAVVPTVAAAAAVDVQQQESRFRTNNREQQQQQQQQDYFVDKTPVPSGHGGYMMVKQQQQPKKSKGILSTSPGTGGALMGILTGGRARLMQQQQQHSGLKNEKKKFDSQFAEAARTLTTAEDIGRRAISVAHLGDSRAYFAMKLIMMNESGSSLLSTAPMEGIEEDVRDRDSGAVTDDSSSTEITRIRRRRSSSATDKSMPDAKDQEEGDEMPFAVQAETPPVVIPTRSGSFKGGSCSITISSTRQQQAVKPTLSSIRSCFDEALSCYLKTLRLLKGAVGAAEKAKKDIEELEKQALSADQRNALQNVKTRCEVTGGWLSGQFRGVLERADAANLEIGKLQAALTPTVKPAAPVSVEELIYNHALGFGREGAVKQLLGQFEAARACYRSAGLLAETLLMDPRVEDEDRKTLEGYVNGFAARINELDETMMQQSRTGSVSSASVSRRGPSVVGLVGQPLMDHPGFM